MDVGPLREHLSSVVRTCLHCGMCLPVCPTYDLTMDETSSPRGRIRLISAVMEGRLKPGGAYASEMNFCLDCRACETACPAGVRYGELVEAAREGLRASGGERAVHRLKKYLLLRVVFRSAATFSMFRRLLKFYQYSGLREALERSGLMSVLPSSLRRVLRSLPPVARHPFNPPRDSAAAEGAGNENVGLATGCIMNISFPGIHRDTVEVLGRNGDRILVPPGQFCCGSLHAHNGDTGHARRLARELIAAFPPELETIIVNSAGCGAFMKEYGRLFSDDPVLSGRAAEFAASVRDVNEYLAVRGTRPPFRAGLGRVTYHDACHLVHAQGISTQPRDLLRSIPGLEFSELPDSTRCCGSAGIYNLLEPGASEEFLRQKVERIISTGAEIVCTANPGCHLQIERGLREAGSAAEVVHPVTLLNRAFR